jgi:thiamine pyrophosphate-dependent acetolactate synthase large subunit-like protein
MEDLVMLGRLNEDMIGKLAAQFDTLPDIVRLAIDSYVPEDESPAFYKGYISGVMMVASVLNEQKISINYDVLVALAGKAAQVRQGLLAEEQNVEWLDKIDAWIEASYRSEISRTDRH